VLVADALGLDGHEPAAPARTEQRKLVTFVPHAHLEALRDAIFAAGAGSIGHYSRCSAYVEVTGTFYGEEGSEPVVGLAGREERVPEVRLEAVYPAARERELVDALVAAHPYEEPAFDLYPLLNVRAGQLQGRVGTLVADPVARLEAAGAGPAFRRRPTAGSRVAVFTALPGPVVADCVVAPAGDPDVLAPQLEAWALARLEPGEAVP
jgi:hypothetical protein